MNLLTQKLCSKVVLALLCTICFGFAYGQNVTLCHNGNTITVSPNAVNAHLNHGDVLGACASSCINPALIDPNRACIALYDPVCGCDGNTYSNGCVATFGYGVTSYTPGACANACIGTPTGMFCPTYVDPVCGCDGNTYSNACFAAAAGITSSTPGACGSGSKRAQATHSDAEIFPNPANGLAKISWTSGDNQATKVYIMDMVGKTVFESAPIMAIEGGINTYQFDATDLESGIYIVQVRSGQTAVSQKMVVQH